MGGDQEVVSSRPGSQVSLTVLTCGLQHHAGAAVPGTLEAKAQCRRPGSLAIFLKRIHR